MTYANISQNEYGEKIKKSSLITLGVVLFLIFIKAFAYFATGSIIILSLLADSFFDLIITLTTFILVRISLKKNTNEYRFGYGKAEEYKGKPKKESNRSVGLEKSETKVKKRSK